MIGTPPGQVTFLSNGLVSLVDGEERDENFSLRRGFIPNSSLILLKKKIKDRSINLNIQWLGVFLFFFTALILQGLLGLLHVVVLGVILHICIR